MAGRLRGTVRFRITAIAALAVAVVLGVTATALVLAQSRQLTANLDRTLRQTADDLETLLANASDPPGALADRGPEGFVQIVVAGRVVAATPNLRGRDPLDRILRTSDGAIVTTADLPHDDDTFRVLTRVIRTPDGRAMLYVGASHDEVTDGVAALISSLAFAVPAVALLLAGLVWWLTGRALAPVEAIRREVTEIGAGALDRRVPVPDSGDEIARLARTMNQMLDRVQESIEREQRFVADASHELRTPLTRMRAEVEVAKPGEEPATLDSVRNEIVEMQALIDDLLYLARAGAGVTRSDPAPLDLDDLVMREAQRVKAAGRVAVDTSEVSAVLVDGQAGELSRAIRNVMENAERYAATTITLTLREHDGFAELAIADNGPGIPTAARTRIFERFGRPDESRAAETGGAGLGLSIARDIVTGHGGSIEIGPSTQGARFTIRLPLAPGSAIAANP
ncbi:MAG: sensor histidine kinase [Actinomycetota bacterium]